MTDEDWEYVEQVLMPFLRAIKNIPREDREHFLPMAMRLLGRTAPRKGRKG